MALATNGTIGGTVGETNRRGEANCVASVLLEVVVKVQKTAN